MRETFLPFSRPSFGEDELAELADCMQSGWITTGPKVERFATMFTEYVGASHAAPVSSATAGLHLALLAYDIGPGDEVVTTPMTFVATLNVIVLVGATPVLVDCDRDTLQIRVDEIERRITPRTRAVLPVHFAGQPVDMDAILGVARRHGLVVIEDAAHAAGTEYRGRKIGGFPTTSVFSFHPNKNITTGEGGMVVTDDDRVHEKVSLLRFHGMDRTAWKRFTKSGSSRYDVVQPGYKYNMLDMQAALGIHQLPKLDAFIEERRRRAEAYNVAFNELPGLLVPCTVPYPARHAWHLYTPLVDIDRLRIDRDRFMQELKDRNIGTGLHYTAAHEFTYYARAFGWKPEDFPDAHFVSERVLSLPLFPDMTDDDQADVIDAVRDVCTRFAR